MVTQERRAFKVVGLGQGCVDFQGWSDTEAVDRRLEAQRVAHEAQSRSSPVTMVVAHEMVFRSTTQCSKAQAHVAQTDGSGWEVFFPSHPHLN